MFETNFGTNFGMIQPDGGGGYPMIDANGTIYTPPIYLDPIVGAIDAPVDPYQTGGIKVPPPDSSGTIVQPIDTPPIAVIPPVKELFPIPEDVKITSPNTRYWKLKKPKMETTAPEKTTTEKDESDLIFGFEPKTLLLVGAAGAAIYFLASQSKGK